MDDENDQPAEAQDHFNYDNTQSEESETVSTKSWRTCTVLQALQVHFFSERRCRVG